MEVSKEKNEIRSRIWKLMDELGIARFPKPVTGRIPNFQGAEKAALRLTGLREFQQAGVVKVNPDSPQNPVRRAVLQEERKLIMPTPRLRKGFLLLDTKMIPKGSVEKSSTIRGAFKFGRPTALEDLPKVDFIVAGSVAVSPKGARIGKGGGYSELEYGILRELNLIDEKTPIATTVHDGQLVDEAPIEEHDFLVDFIVTPTRIIRTNRKRSQPQGIIWSKITSKMLEEMPILRELRSKEEEN